MTTPEREYDLFKDSPIRLLGYANEVGEALRGFIGSKMVAVSYGIATLYVLADTTDKTGKSLKRHGLGETGTKKVIFAASDTLIWQMLASVAIPGFTINRVCSFSNYALLKTVKLPSNKRKFIVTSIGLAVIPFIIKPIDRFVDFLLDNSIRKFTPLE